MNYTVEVYDDGDDILPELPDERHNFETLAEAVTKAMSVAIVRYKFEEVSLWTDSKELGDSAFSFYEPGQPGNVVVRQNE